MRRKLIALALVMFMLRPLFSAVVPDSGRVSTYLRGTLSPALVSENVYSSPAKNGKLHFALGGDFTLDLYRNDSSAKWGFSVSLYGSYPVVSKKYSKFEASDISEKKAFLMAGAGCVFRCTPLTYVDMSLALRLEVMSYDYFSSLMLGLTAESRADVFMSDRFFITGGFSLTNALIRFTPSSQTTWYERGYTALLMRCHIGAGYRLGEERTR